MRFAARAASRRWDHRGAGRCRGERRRFVGALRRVGRTGRRTYRQRRSEIVVGRRVFRAPEIRDPRFDAPGCRALTRRAGGTSRTYRQRRSEIDRPAEIIGPPSRQRRSEIRRSEIGPPSRQRRSEIRPRRRSGPVGDRPRPANVGRRSAVGIGPSETGPVPSTSVGDRPVGDRPPSRQRRSEIGRSEIGPVNVGRRSAPVGDRPPSRQHRSEIGPVPSTSVGDPPPSTSVGDRQVGDRQGDRPGRTELVQESRQIDDVPSRLGTRFARCGVSLATAEHGTACGGEARVIRWEPRVFLWLHAGRFRTWSWASCRSS